MTAWKENQRSKNEILEKKTFLRTKKRDESLVEEGTGTSSEKLKLNHVSSRTHNLEEVLKLLNLEKYWICHIPLFQIRESTTNVKESSSNLTCNRLVSLATKMVESRLKVYFDMNPDMKSSKQIFYVIYTRSK